MKQPEFSNEKKKRFLRKFPSSFHGGGAGVRGGGGGAGREGSDTSVLLPTSTASAAGSSGMPSPPRAGRDAGQPRCIAAPQGPHSVYFMKGCSAAPAAATHLRTAAGSHGRRSCQVPLPAALRARAGAGKSGAGLLAPMGSLGAAAGGDATTEVPVILKIPVPERGRAGTCFSLTRACGCPWHGPRSLR